MQRSSEVRLVTIIFFKYGSSLLGLVKVDLTVILLGWLVLVVHKLPVTLFGISRNKVRLPEGGPKSDRAQLR